MTLVIQTINQQPAMQCHNYINNRSIIWKSNEKPQYMKC